LRPLTSKSLIIPCSSVVASACISLNCSVHLYGSGMAGMAGICCRFHQPAQFILGIFLERLVTLFFERDERLERLERLVTLFLERDERLERLVTLFLERDERLERLVTLFLFALLFDCLIYY